jgi:uncharacterized protein
MIPIKVRRRIDEALAELERRHGVRILLAVESGSRAWGFPSPDSDYDVRFIYVRPTDWYLALFPGRDVIEEPLDGDLDIVGWDVQKALRLLVKANPALLEWLASPIVYRHTPDVEALRQLAGHSPYRRSARHHYLALARSNYDRYIAGRQVVKLKKYMYCLRPAVALLWMRTHEGRVPMDLPSLLAGVDLPTELLRAVDDLLALKVASVEMGESPPIPVIDAFIEGEIAEAGGRQAQPPLPDADMAMEAEALFRRLIDR